MRAAAYLILLVLAAAIAMPSAAAQSDASDAPGPDPNCNPSAGCYDARLKDCGDWKCIGQALLGGAVRVVSSFFIGVGAIIGGALVGIWDFILKPFFSAIGEGLGAAGDSLGELLGGIGEKAREAMGQTWLAGAASLREALGPFGVLAIPIMVIIVIGIIVGILWVMSQILDRGDDPAPAWLERWNKDSDKEDAQSLADRVRR